jgi:hypothetical protein
MLPLHTQQVLSDLERGVRRKAEHERRLRTERTSHDPYGMDGEIRVLVERGLKEAPRLECEDELSQAAG